MGSRERAIDTASKRGHATIDELLRELHDARVDRGLSGSTVAAAVGLSRAQYSRLERGLTADLSIIQASRVLAAVGLRLSARAYPDGEPLRDAVHASLLSRFRAELHRSLRYRSEVSFPGPGDRRAWDALVSGPGWRMGVEAETRPRDLQALERRLELKLRDGDVDRLCLLLLDSRYNRELLRAHGDALAGRFPIAGRRALELLRAGVDPGGNTIIVL
jgi:transcriptional regulator with XRE-family HTH domain